ncbi:MAG: ABC transporter ATP-binding protein [Chloroflexi bacterium]|nr:ABC transporter ATP-binding protein [Chloroflexota bacterium]
MRAGQLISAGLARALVLKPKILLLDEPLSNLDAKLRVRMRDEIRRIQQQFQITTIYVTHDQEEALTMADRIAVMQRGAIEQLGSAVEIYEEPHTPFVADFIGSSNFFRGTIERSNGCAHMRVGDIRFGRRASAPPHHPRPRLPRSERGELNR